MSLVLNGNGTIQNLVAGGLPDGSVTADDIASTLDLSGKTVTLAAGGTGYGKVLQVVSTSVTTLITASSDTKFSIMSASITPSSSSSKILVQYFVSHEIGNNEFLTYLDRGVTPISHYTGGDITGYERGGSTMGGSAPSDYTWSGGVSSCVYLDSPSTTSATTYTVYGFRNGATAYVNRSRGTNSGDSQGGSSGIVLMEIAA